MKYEIKDLPESKVKIEVELSPEEFDSFCGQALKKIAGEIELPGFRKGKVPEKMAEEKINPGALLSEASELAVRDSWIKILKESDIEAISQPEIEITKVAKGNPFIFSLAVETLPKFQLPDVKSIADGIKKDKADVAEKEVEDALNQLRQMRAKLSEKEGAAEAGDLVEFVFKIINGPADLPKTEQHDGFILGKGHYIEGMEKELTGIKSGEEKEFAGKVAFGEKGERKENVKVWVKAEAIKKLELPELNDEWAKSLGRFESLENLKQDLKKSIGEEKETANCEKRRFAILEKISDKTKIEVPKTLIEREEHALLDNLKNRVNAEMGISFEEYLQKSNKTEEQVKKDFGKIAEQRIKTFLILNQIEKDEKITVEEKEIEERIGEMAKRYPDAEKARQELGTGQSKFYIEDEIKREKVFKILGC